MKKNEQNNGFVCPNHRRPIFANGLAGTLIVLASAILLLLGGCRQSRDGRHFGEPFSKAPQVAIGRLLAEPDAFHRQTVRVAGVIKRQCPASGCWFFLNDGQGNELRVELGDYFPKLPQNIGHRAEVEGELIRRGDKFELIGTRVTFFQGEEP